MTVPTAAEWREAAVPAVLKFMARCYDAGYKDALDAEPEARRWNALLKEGEGDNDILAALRPLIERLERALDASTVTTLPEEFEVCGGERHCTCVGPLRSQLERAQIAVRTTRTERDADFARRLKDLAAATEAAALWEAEAARLRKWCPGFALSHPRPAPGKVVALVEEFKYKAGLLRATAPTTNGTDRIVGRTWAAAAELLARALGMEESP